MKKKAKKPSQKRRILETLPRWQAGLKRLVNPDATCMIPHTTGNIGSPIKFKTTCHKGANMDVCITTGASMTALAKFPPVP